VDLGGEWKAWTGLPFVFAVWAARRDAGIDAVQAVHRRLLESRAWGLAHLDALAAAAAQSTGVQESVCRAYLGELDYALSYRHLAGLTDFFRRLAQEGLVPDGSLSFISAA
jgi:chorismate dehydratase